jgi:molecular chaperone DnaK
MGDMLGRLIGRGAAWLKSILSHDEVTAPSSAETDRQTKSRSLAVGIDLGTTLSAAAYISETGHTTMVRNSIGEILTPSVVLFEREKVIVGSEAKKAAGTRIDAVAECVKRDMGSKTYSHTILGKRIPPEVIQAYILKQIKADIDALLGEKYSVVITVPAYFDEPRRQATADAGQMAGLEVIDIVNEPTAAALAFGEQAGYLGAHGKTRDTITVLVYDLGGGTFDVTLIQLRPDDIRTLATDGDVRLGGRDWDGRLVKWLGEQFLASHATDPRENPADHAMLFNLAEQAKCALSVRPQTTVAMNFSGQQSSITLTRDIFEELTEDLLERTAYTTRQVLASAKNDWSGIDRILLVGGSTRMPMVARMLEQQSGITPDRSVNPDEAVARGAALYAQSLLAEETGQNSLKIVSVNSHSLGIEGTNVETNRREHAILIPRNSPLPAHCSRRCVTANPGQRSVVVKVLEGESADPANCIMVGRAILPDLPRDLPKGHPVEVTYHYSRSGRLQVRARVPGTDRALNVEFQRDRNYSTDRILCWQETIRSGNGSDGFERMLEEVVAGIS